MMNAEKLLFKNDLPNDFAFWVKIALACVECSKALQLDARYLERFEKFKTRLDIINNEYGKSATPDIYAAAVVELDGYIDELRDNADTPDNVKELFKRYDASIENRRPSYQITSIRTRLEWLKDDLDKDEDALDDVQSDISATRSELRDIEKEIDKLREMFSALFNKESDGND